MLVPKCLAFVGKSQYEWEMRKFVATVNKQYIIQYKIQVYPCLEIQIKRMMIFHMDLLLLE